jgi:hypothetical protein
MKKNEVQMLLYTLTKKIIEVQGQMLNAFGIILFCKVVGWFDGQNISVKPKQPMFNPFYQHILCGVYIYIYIFSYIYLVHVFFWNVVEMSHML